MPPEFPAVADPLLVRALCSAAQELDEPVRVGMYRSHDAKQVELEVALPANVSAGVIGGPYTVQVSLSETDGGNTES